MLNNRINMVPSYLDIYLNSLLSCQSQFIITNSVQYFVVSYEIYFIDLFQVFPHLLFSRSIPFYVPDATLGVLQVSNELILIKIPQKRYYFYPYLIGQETMCIKKLELIIKDFSRQKNPDLDGLLWNSIKYLRK